MMGNGGHGPSTLNGGPSPRGNNSNSYQYGGSGSNAYNPNNSTSNMSNGNVLMMSGGMRDPLNNNPVPVPVGAISSGHRKHRASSRQSNNKNHRRHHNRYVESGNYGASSSGASQQGSHHQQSHQQQQQGQYNAPSPSSTLLMSSPGFSSEGTAGHSQQYHHNQQQQHHYQQQQPHAPHVLPHINAPLHHGHSQTGSGPGPGSSALGMLSASSGASRNNSNNNVLAATNIRNNMYMNMSSPPSPALNQASNGVPSSAFVNAPAPVLREFQSGNVLTNTEEHAHAAVTSIRGLKPGNPNWINQDNFFVTENFEGRDIRIYCVLDGHGEHGHLVSRRCREMFPQFIKSARLDIDSAFNMMQNDLNAASDMDVRCSGATCVMATIIGGKVSVYNCGDSRAVLGRRNPNGSIYAVALSKDHKPDKAEERKRILSCGGHLGCRQVLVNQPGRGPVSMPVGPCRVWYQHRGETLGLAMSRSLGDSIVHKSGVSAEPECIERPVDDYDDFLILATDGVWDVVDNNYAVQLVQSFAAKSANWSPLEASSSVCRFARSRWEKLSPMIDDISCIVVKIHR